MQEDAKKIADRLTGAQRNWVRFWFMPGRGYAQCRSALERLGLINGSNLTELGCLVRAELIRQNPAEPA